MVGDTLRDLQAAQAAGCEPHLVLPAARRAWTTTQTQRSARPGARRTWCTTPGGLRRAPAAARGAADSVSGALLRCGGLGPALGAVRDLAGGHRGALGASRCCWLSIFVRGSACTGHDGWLRMAIWGAA
jgi:hypothetical protein